jgi:hypothetical protein
MLSGITIGKALDNFIQSQCGMNSWYSVDGALEYGFYNNLVTIDPKKEFFESSSKHYTNNDQIDPDYVTVWNSDCSVYTVYGIDPHNETASCAVGVSYVMSSTLMDRELTLIAKKIHDDLKVSQDQFKVRFPAGTVRFQEGDVFMGMGDQTTFPLMPYKSGVDLDPLTDPKDSIWQIRDIIITETATDVIVGTSYRSIFDIYHGTLIKKDEVASPTEVKEWKSNVIYTNVVDT